MPFTEKNAKKIFNYMDFKVEGTPFFDGSTSLGWRITAIHQKTQNPYEYWVREGEIYLIDCPSPKPWNHATPFILGKRVTRIDPEVRQAVHRAMAHWCPASEPTPPGRRIKMIAEGPYVGLGVRRSSH